MTLLQGESQEVGFSYIDPQFGYRYYRLEQLARADAIRSLRLVNMPLPETTGVTIEPGVVASIIHRGSYDNIGQSYAADAAWIQARGHSIIGPTREIYLNSPTDVDEADLLSELLFPVDAEEVDVALAEEAE